MKVTLSEGNRVHYTARPVVKEVKVTSAVQHGMRFSRLELPTKKC